VTPPFGVRGNHRIANAGEGDTAPLGLKVVRIFRLRFWHLLLSIVFHYRLSLPGFCLLFAPTWEPFASSEHIKKADVAAHPGVFDHVGLFTD
jgi:hypothetical protein